MTKYYIDYYLLKSPFDNTRTAIKVTNNYLIRFVDSDIIYYFRLDSEIIYIETAYGFREYRTYLKNAYVIDDEIAHQKILVFNDGDLYLLENK